MIPRGFSADTIPEGAMPVLKEMVRKQGVPDAWCETEAFKENLARLFAALGPEPTRAIITALRTMSWSPLYERLSRTDSSLLAPLLYLTRVPLTLAFDQPVAAVAPEEAYVPMPGFTADFEPEPLDLTTPAFADRFFYHHERGPDVADEHAIDRALRGITPEIIAIGSGPAAGAALTSLFERKRGTEALVLDVGDYYRQEDYDARTPCAVGIEAYKDGSANLIMNGLSRPTVNFVPQVFGGGGEVFSGTAHAVPEWYQRQLPLTPEAFAFYERLVRSECRISRTPWDILNDGQKLFYKGAEKLGLEPYLLEGFGRGGDKGQGRCYAGKKERIPYLDRLFRGAPGLRGIANCRIDAIVRNADGSLAALELAFLSRSSRRVIAHRSLAVPPRCHVLLAAGSLGDQRILERSGDPHAVQRRPGVIHQYCTEVAGLFPEPLSANGIPQGMACELVPERVDKDGRVARRIGVYGAHPGRTVLAALGGSNHIDRMHLLQNTPYIGTVGIMFTEGRPGTHVESRGVEMTLQRLTKEDMHNLWLSTDKSLRIWREAGARGLMLNIPTAFPTRDKELGRLGFAATDELEALSEYSRTHPPLLQTFYRTGHRFGTVSGEDGGLPGFRGLHLVGEDVIPPGPGVNPTLAICILARAYGHAIAEQL